MHEIKRYILHCVHDMEHVSYETNYNHCAPNICPISRSIFFVVTITLWTNSSLVDINTTIVMLFYVAIQLLLFNL